MASTHTLNTHLDVVVRKRKYDNVVRMLWEGRLVGPSAVSSPTQEWAVVLHHPDFHRRVKKGARKQQTTLFLQCLSTAHPLTVLMEYSLDGVFMGAKCDAALPAKHLGHAIEFCDLDLDLMVKSDLSSFVRDQKTFRRNTLKMKYPSQVVKMAHQGIGLAQQLLATRQFPFEARFVPLLQPIFPLDVYRIEGK